MGTTANKIIALAQSWIGKNEADGTHAEIIDIYNGHKPLARGYKVKNTDSWCAATISALAIKLGATDIIPTECSCQKMIALCKSKGIFIEGNNRVPNVGDIIFYDWENNDWSDHVGIVEKVSGSTITVIEGNYSNSVKRRSVAVNDKRICGYAVPKYAAELELDGKWGKDTTTRSQEVYGTTVDGIVSNQKLTSKKYVPGASTSSWKFKLLGYSKGSSLIKAIQTDLKAKFYYTGKNDGWCEKGTATAIQKFLFDLGFYKGKITGELDKQTVIAWQKYINSKL